MANNQSNSTSNELNELSPSVQVHLGILQGVINRMSSNSNSSKAWCVTLVSALLVVVADKNKPDYALIAIIPTLLFFALDVYYLVLEKGFRDSYNDFVHKVHNKTLNIEDLFSVKPTGNMCEHISKSICSYSVWGFYLPLIILIIVTRIFVI